MRTVGHIIASAGVGLLTYHYYKSVGAGVASFLSGWMIDLDHVVDYVKAHGWRPHWERVNEARHEDYSGKLYLPLHSYELLALFFFIFRSPKKRAYRVGITLSVFTHLLLDQKYNPRRKPLTYFLAHRAYKRFNSSDILKKS